MHSINAAYFYSLMLNFSFDVFFLIIELFSFQSWLFEIMKKKISIPWAENKDLFRRFKVEVKLKVSLGLMAERTHVFARKVTEQRNWFSPLDFSVNKWNPSSGPFQDRHRMHSLQHASLEIHCPLREETLVFLRKQGVHKSSSLKNNQWGPLNLLEDFWKKIKLKPHALDYPQ